MGEKWKQRQILFFGAPKIIVDSNCSHEIKRCLLLRRKAITNLDNVLKSRDITLLTKVCLAKAMVFPVIMYRCESWTIKKVECWRIDAFKPVNPNGKQPWIFIGRNDAEVEAPILWPLDVKSRLMGKDPDAGKDWGQEEKGMTEDEIVGWHHWLNGHEFEQTPGDGEGQGSLVCWSSSGHKESDTTEQPNNNN